MVCGWKSSAHTDSSLSINRTCALRRDLWHHKQSHVDISTLSQPHSPPEENTPSQKKILCTFITPSSLRSRSESQDTNSHKVMSPWESGPNGLTPNLICLFESANGLIAVIHHLLRRGNARGAFIANPASPNVNFCSSQRRDSEQGRKRHHGKPADCADTEVTLYPGAISKLAEKMRGLCAMISSTRMSKTLHRSLHVSKLPRCGQNDVGPALTLEKSTQSISSLTRNPVTSFGFPNLPYHLFQAQSRAFLSSAVRCEDSASVDMRPHHPPTHCTLFLTCMGPKTLMNTPSKPTLPR